MFKTKKVSDTKIKVVKNPDNELTAKGADWFPIVYSNIFLLGKKFSGKTVVIENILQKTAGKNTKFIFIVSTINKDPSYKRILKYLEKKGHDVITYDDIYDYDSDGKKINVIEEFIVEQKAKGEEEEENIQIGEGQKQIIQQPPPIKKSPFTFCDSFGNYNIPINKGPPVVETKQPIEIKPTNIEQKGKGAEKKKVIYPEYIIVIDDMGATMRDKWLTQLLKTNRHYKCKVIMSGQNLNDLDAPARKQLDYCLIFGRLPSEKIEQLKKDLDLTITEQQLEELYKNATSEPFQFLYIGRSPGHDTYRKGFTEQYQID